MFTVTVKVSLDVKDQLSLGVQIRLSLSVKFDLNFENRKNYP